MRSFRGFFGFLSALTVVVVEAFDYAVAFARVALDLFSPSPPRALAGGFDMQLEIGGHALPADVQQSLRHEAGVPRYAARRNT